MTHISSPSILFTTVVFLLAVPPSIVDKETSMDMVVREAANVTLTCKAVGYPEPYVMWRREDGEDINYNGENGE
jgi:neurotrimin